MLCGGSSNLEEVGPSFAERVQQAEVKNTAVSGSTTDTATHSRTWYEEYCESSDVPDSLSAVVNDPRVGMLASGEADQPSLVPVDCSFMTYVSEVSQLTPASRRWIDS
ncbi:unnamed protein product [Phytophthora fragariaefolia]|uniref:Unnamed protein product n=1 Tax=Phytophthora fragariaefolia TaxID=1490495 RepID=A0A9W7D4K2_9STRA|nr:unnamed protein product [Phytophthora fragariaefolia]